MRVCVCVCVCVCKCMCVCVCVSVCVCVCLCVHWTGGGFCNEESSLTVGLSALDR